MLWAQGWRFTINGPIRTGVVHLSAADRFGVFLDGEYLDNTNETVLGVPLGRHVFCFQAPEKIRSCEIGEVKEAQVFSHHNIYLPPSPPHKPFAAAEKVLFDPLGRGLLRVFLGQKSVLVLEDENQDILDDISGTAYELSSEGNLLLPEEEPIALFKNPLPKLLTEEGGNLLHISEQQSLLLYAGEHRREIEFSEEITKAFFLEDSDSFVVVLETEVYFFPTPNASRILLLEKTAETPVLFFPEEKKLFWQAEGMIWEMEL